MATTVNLDELANGAITVNEQYTRLDNTLIYLPMSGFKTLIPEVGDDWNFVLHIVYLLLQHRDNTVWRETPLHLEY